MKTISEMQVELRDISSRINELTKELSDYNQFNSEEIVIDFSRLQTIAIRQPIKGHLLARSSDDIKKRYITILTSLVYLATEHQEKGWILIQRIACGVGIKEKLSKIAIDGLNLTEQQLDKFTGDIVSSKLSNSFVLDCMLIYLSCEQKNKKMLKYMSGLFELVKCGNVEITELLQIAKIIATQNTKGYLKLSSKIFVTNKMAYLCYAKELPV